VRDVYFKEIMRKRPGLMLVVGFGGLLLIMAAAETGAWIILERLRGSGVALQENFLRHNHDLEEIRSHVYLSGTYARDALLAPESSGADIEFAALRKLRLDNEAALQRYSKSMDPGEAVPFAALRSEIEAYWNVLEHTFGWTEAERMKYRYRFFYEELIPRRTAMLQIADQIEALNARGLKQGGDRQAGLSGRLQLVLLLTIAATLLGGAALAGVTIAHIMRLQKESRERLEESVRTRGSLQDLSAKLLRAQEDERRALARELHDELGQSFSAILMEVENLNDLATETAIRSRLEPIRALAEKGVNETRNMSLLLRPSMLDDFGLLPALDWQVRETAKRTGLNVTMAATNVNDQLPEEHKTCIYRVTQEALNNCARHAQATSVQVVVRGEEGRIRVSVHDDGSGFDAERVRGLGLLGMEERVRHLGGKLTVGSRPGRGTLLSVELPVTSFHGANGNGSRNHTAG
jgi:signal transduction histidine kinase